MCQGTFNGIKKVVKEVSRMFQVCFKKGYFLRMSQGCLKRFFSGFQGYLKEVQREFH